MADGEWLLDDWREWMALQGLSPRTIDRRTWSIGQWLAHCGDLESVEPEDLEDFLRRWPARSSRASIQSDVRRLYVHARRRGVLIPDPTAHAEQIRVPRRVATPVTADEVHLLIAVTRPPVRTMIMLGALAGMRASEIAAVQGADVRPREALIVVRTGKGGKSRIVPLHPMLEDELQPLPPGRYFPGVTGGAVGKRVKRAMASWGVDARPHDLRAAFGTEAARVSGGNMVLVQQLMGHSSVDTTQRYVRWAPDGAAVIRALFSAA